MRSLSTSQIEMRSVTTMWQVLCCAALLTCTYHDKVKRKARDNNITISSPSLHSSIEPLTLREDTYPDQNVDAFSGILSGVHTPLLTSSEVSRAQCRQPGGSCSTIAAPSRSRSPPASKRVSSQLLRMHVQLFKQWMFPVWPVVRLGKTLADCEEPDALTPK